MKRITAFALSLFITLSSGLAAYTEFYVTKGAGASDLNGGGSRLGANDAPIAVCTDATIAGGALTTIVDNTAGNWAGVQVDDFLCWDTAGVKEIRRVSALAPGGDATKITIASAATAGANKDVHIGGAWATVDFGASAIVWTSAAWHNAASAPPCLNVKYSATAYNEYVVVDNAGDNDSPARIEGYETAAHDGCPTGNLPNIDGTGCTGDAVVYCALTTYDIQYLYCTTNVNGDHGISCGNSGIVSHCKVAVTGTASDGIITGSWSTVVDCLVADSGRDGIAANTGSVVFDCVSLSAGRYGFNVHSGVTCVGCISHDSADDGFRLDAALGRFISCTSDGSVAGSGFFLYPISGPCTVWSCLATNNNQYGIEVWPTYVMSDNAADYNAFYNNGVAAKDPDLLNAGAHDVTLTGDPYTNLAGHDFSLNATAGAGAACRAAGFPGTLLDGVNIGKLDIGALQHADPAGGSGIPSHLRGGHVQ